MARVTAAEKKEAEEALRILERGSDKEPPKEFQSENWKRKTAGAIGIPEISAQPASTVRKPTDSG